jgi:hypothetical protein
VPRSTLVIEELTGRRRKLDLRGGGLPAKGASFASGMRLATSFLPGNGVEATQQVLGPREGEPEWEGSWSTPVLASEPSFYSEVGGNEQRVARAKTLVEIVESITASGALLRITWSQDGDLTWVRQGRIEEFDPQPRTRDDVDWSIKWQWTGRGGSTKRVISLKKDGQLATHKKIENELNKLTAELNAASLFSSNRDILASASSFSLGDLEAFVEGIKDFTGQFANLATQIGSRIRQIGDLIQSVEELPADVAQQFVDAAASVVSSCAEFSDSVSRQGPEVYARFDQSASVKTLVNASTYLSSVKAAADEVVRMAAEARAALIKKSGIQPGSPGTQGKPVPDAVTFVIARQGDTFASIAKRKLGDPSLGPAVARATGYSWLDVAPRVGEVVVVPSAKSAAGLMPGA